MRTYISGIREERGWYGLTNAGRTESERERDREERKQSAFLSLMRAVQTKLNFFWTFHVKQPKSGAASASTETPPDSLSSRALGSPQPCP